jgi:hypothetical protein
MASIQPIFCAFYTVATRYEQEAARLRQSLLRHGLEYDIVGVPDAGSWVANTHRTAQFCCDMQAKHSGRPVVYLDADSVCWKRPDFLFGLNPLETDIAFHRRRGVELLNGCVWFANNETSRALCARHAELCRLNPTFRDEQRFLWQAVEELKPRWASIPASYCWIADIMAEDLGGDEPVFEMLQASRESSNSTLLPNRRARLAYLASQGLA